MTNDCNYLSCRQLAASAQALVKQGLLNCLQKEQNRSTLRKVRA